MNFFTLSVENNTKQEELLKEEISEKMIHNTPEDWGLGMSFVTSLDFWHALVLALSHELLLL